MLYWTKKIYIAHVSTIEDSSIAGRCSERFIALKREDDGRTVSLRNQSYYYHIKELYPIAKNLKDNERLSIITDDIINRLLKRLNETNKQKVLIKN